MNQPIQFQTIKTSTAAKTGERANGVIGYRVLTDSNKSDVYIRIESNDGSGYFSRELIPFSKIEACLLGMESCQSLPAKTFRPAFIGKSSNNAGFLAAILRAEGLMAADMSKGYSHRVSADWSKWKSDMLALPAIPFTIDESEEVNEKPSSKKPKASTSHVPTGADDGGKRKGKKSDPASHPATGSEEANHADPA